MRLKLPVGMEFFGRLREENLYYADKTGFIRALLRESFSALLITRPRRFGKTLTMSMLEDFFAIDHDSSRHFEGLEIAKEKELCQGWMNKYPTIFLTLKGMEGLDFDSARERLAALVADWCTNHDFLCASTHIKENDKAIYKKLAGQKADKDELVQCFLFLSKIMSVHYGRPVILLIDEYDVPLAKAAENGYYREMMDFLRALLGGALKTNPYLKFAVITGCLRISKESVFTGLNNLVIDTVSDNTYSKYVGFTTQEVQQLLAAADLSGHFTEIREWYDGYRFGNTEMYCPWSVLGHVAALQRDNRALPKCYWANSSHNGIIYQSINRKNLNVKGKLESLMAGGILTTPIEENLTYDTLTSSEKNLWSLLYLTGYLTLASKEKCSEELPRGFVALEIPNEEVRSIFQTAVVDWLNDYVAGTDRQQLFEALWQGDAAKAQKLVSDILFTTISYHDYLESYYHAFLTGLFAGAGYMVESNYELGLGRPDVVVKDAANRRALVLEAKRAKTEEEIPLKCREAVRQIRERKYLEGIEKGYRNKLAYAIVFHGKDCFMEKA